MAKAHTKPKHKSKVKPLHPRFTKEVSVMAWIEDPDHRVLFVRQAAGMRLWTLPGGKVKRGESLLKATRREVSEEVGVRIQIGSLLGALDRHDKDAITLLFAAVLGQRNDKLKSRRQEIKKVAFQSALPKKSSPSARYFWSARRGLVGKQKIPTVPASTYQLADR
jgi:ADP-ribose pyrophosphatase YjhB (NUDIX family)